MGSWLFSISPCRIEPYTINPHPGTDSVSCGHFCGGQFVP